MTEEQFEKVGELVIELFYKLSEDIPKEVVIAGIIGGLAAITKVSSMTTEGIVAAFQSAREDLE